jgi:hypothetical protein
MLCAGTGSNRRFSLGRPGQRLNAADGTAVVNLSAGVLAHRSHRRFRPQGEISRPVPRVNGTQPRPQEFHYPAVSSVGEPAKSFRAQMGLTAAALLITERASVAVR